MYDITLVATTHSENGKYNSEELYKVLEGLSPDVIFDELSKNWYDLFFHETFDERYQEYKLRPRIHGQRELKISVEVECLKRYSRSYDVEIVPIDADVSAIISLHKKEIDFMWEGILNNCDYRQLLTKVGGSILSGGLNFLNSNDCLAILEKKEALEMSIIESSIDKDKLLDAYMVFQKYEHTFREDVMLQNIFNYSNENEYNQAVFLVGVDHKRSIMGKIAEYQRSSAVKLNWTMYGGI